MKNNNRIEHKLQYYNRKQSRIDDKTRDDGRRQRRMEYKTETWERGKFAEAREECHGRKSEVMHRRSIPTTSGVWAPWLACGNQMLETQFSGASSPIE
jgi:hypothetical protein